MIACDLDVDPGAAAVAVGRGNRRPPVHAGRRPARRRAARPAEGNPQQQMPGAGAAGAPARGRPASGWASTCPPAWPTRERLRAAPGAGREGAPRVRQREPSRARRCRCRAVRRLRRRRRQARRSRRCAAASRPSWARCESELKDPRFPELLFRYRARNWPQTPGRRRAAALGRLPPAAAWRRQRPVRIQLRFLLRFDRRACVSMHGPGPAQALLDALEAWGREIESSL